MELTTVAAHLEAPFAACVQEIRIEPRRIVFLYEDLSVPVDYSRPLPAVKAVAPPPPRPSPQPRPPRQPRVWRETLPVREYRPPTPGYVEESCRECGQPFGVDRTRSWEDRAICGPCLSARFAGERRGAGA